MLALKLAIPVQYDSDNPAVELNEKNVCRWLENLPLFNFTESVYSLLNNLKPLNEHFVSDKSRLRLLDFYRTPILKIIDAFELQLLRQLPIDSQQREQLLTDSTALCLELANGYKIIVKNGIEAQKNPAKDQILLMATFRAMETLCTAAVHSFRLYKLPSKHVFLEIYQLYHFALSYKVSHIRVFRESNLTSIDQLFKSILLLSIIDPYHLQEGDIFPILHFLSNCSHLCILHDALPQDQDGIGLFGFYLDQDVTPKLVEHMQVTGEAPHLCILDVRAFLATLLKQIRLNQQKGVLDSQSLEHKILSRIVPNLAAIAQNRRTPRQDTALKVFVAIDVPAIHLFLSGQTEQLLEKNNPTDSGMEVLSINSDYADMPIIETWEITNESEHGYKLHQSSSLTQSVKVGDLVGIENKKTENNPAMAIATIKWVKRHPESGVEIGVEKLCDQCEAVLCQLQGEEKLVPALLLDAAGKQHKPRLITTKNALTPDTYVEISTQQQHLRYKIQSYALDSKYFDVVNLILV